MLLQLGERDETKSSLLFDPLFAVVLSSSIRNMDIRVDDWQISFVFVYCPENRNYRESIGTLDFADDHNIALLEEMLTISPPGVPSRFDGQEAPPRRSKRIEEKKLNDLELP